MTFGVASGRDTGVVSVTVNVSGTEFSTVVESSFETEVATACKSNE